MTVAKPNPTPNIYRQLQVQALCKGVTVAAPAPGAEQDAFFAAPSHILARMVRDVLTTGDVAETLKDIMPAIVQARAALHLPIQV